MYFYAEVPFDFIVKSSWIELIGYFVYKNTTCADVKSTVGDSESVEGREWQGELKVNTYNSGHRFHIAKIIWFPGGRRLSSERKIFEHENNRHGQTVREVNAEQWSGGAVCIQIHLGDQGMQGLEWFLTWLPDIILA